MQKSLFKISVWGFIFVGILGSLCHFFFEWSGKSAVIGLFCPINESCWEHLKLLFFPYLIWSVAEYFLRGKRAGIIFSKAVGVTVGMLAITAFFYTYTGIVGRSIEFLNILDFFIGVAAAFFTDFAMIKSAKFSKKSDAAGAGVLALWALLFFIYTFAPPFIPFFMDPVNFTYGL